MDNSKAIYVLPKWCKKLQLMPAGKTTNFKKG